METQEGFQKSGIHTQVSLTSWNKHFGKGCHNPGAPFLLHVEEFQT